MLFQIGLNIISSINSGIVRRPTVHTTGSIIYFNPRNITKMKIKPIDLILNILPTLFNTANAKNTNDIMKDVLAINFEELVGNTTLFTDHDILKAIPNIIKITTWLNIYHFLWLPLSL